MQCSELDIDRSETRQLVRSWLCLSSVEDDGALVTSSQEVVFRPARLGLGAKYLPQKPAWGPSNAIYEKLQKQTRSEVALIPEPDHGNGELCNDSEEKRALISTKRKTFDDFQQSLLSQADIVREREKSEKRRLKKQRQRQKKNIAQEQ